MRHFNRSLLIKLIVAFWVVSISGIVIIASLAGRVSFLEFNRFVNDTQYQNLVDKLEDYYSQHGNFGGADYLLVDARQAQTGQAREYLVVDKNGDILLSLAQHLPPGRPSPDLIRFSFPIVSKNQTVAYLMPIRPPRSLTELAAQNIQRINFNILIGVVLATILSLLIGWLMARTIISPLRHLNDATQSIAQGNLETQLAISSTDEIGTLAASFNAMTSSLKRSRDLRRQMTADIAHELRNPLSIILGNAEALSEGVLPATPEALDIIYDEAKHLSRLVDDLRTLSLSESGELFLQRSRVDPKLILDRTASAYAIRAAEKNISIQVQAEAILPQVEVDMERIMQVMSNLLDNSFKHTPSGGSIRLTGSTVENGVEIGVKDNGSGISGEELPLVFERFYRGKQSPTRLQDGSGLGLAISKALVELHKGRISVSSHLGEGTKMTIWLPVPKDG